jgi:hypothetical protein
MLHRILFGILSRPELLGDFGAGLKENNKSRL